MNIITMIVAALALWIMTVVAVFALESVNASTKIYDVVNNPVFKNWGRYIFPLNEHYYSGKTLGYLSLTS